MTNTATCKHILSLHIPVGSKVKTIFFPESSHVAYIKLMGIEHHASTYSVLTHTLDPWGSVKRSKHFFFLMNVVILHIKLKGMEHRASYKHIFCPYTHPQPPDGVKRSKPFFVKVVMLHIKLKGKKFRLTYKQNFDLTHTLDLWVRLKGQILKLYR